MEYKGFVLDDFQVQAIEAIDRNSSVVVSAPTGSGKTLIADYVIDRELKRGIKVFYTAPIKALSNQKYKEFTKLFGEENVGLMTGDIVKNPNAQVVIMTTEIYRNMVLMQDHSLDDLSYVIFDEIHYINDVERGYVWEESIIFSTEKVRFLCLSATIPNAEEFASWIESIKGHKVEVIKHVHRPVPLHKAFFDTELGICELKDIKDAANMPRYEDVWKRKGGKKGKRQMMAAPSHIELIKCILDKLPCLFFNFSRMDCQKKALELSKLNIFPVDSRIVSIVRDKLKDAPPEINQLKSTQILRDILPKGIGFHHAGLIPIMKELVEDLFGKGLIKVLYTTETFAVGINMPAKSVCFVSLRKFDGISFRFLNSKEYFQIAGRAGRRGIDTEGFAYVMVDRRDFDFERYKKITTSDTEPLKSQFKLSINTVLNMIKNHSQDEIDEILVKSFYHFQKYGNSDLRSHETGIESTFNSIRYKLEKLGFLQDSTLTEMGDFASRIYTEEILMGEIFSTGLYKDLDDYQMMLVLACATYEPRERTEFFKTFQNKGSATLRSILKQNPNVAKSRVFKNIEDLTALVWPCYNGKTIFQIIPNVSLQEGDLIRFFRQILDIIGQVKNATPDPDLRDVMDRIKEKILNCIKDIDAI
jgi:superfamily II RNA helicase